MKFLIDMPLSPALAAWLRTQGHDAVHATEIGFQQATDAEILERARREARTVVTADLDYPRLLALVGMSEPSLVLFRGGDWTDATIITRFSDVLGVLTDDDKVGSIMTVDRSRIKKTTFADQSKRGHVEFRKKWAAPRGGPFCYDITISPRAAS